MIILTLPSKYAVRYKMHLLIWGFQRNIYCFIFSLRQPIISFVHFYHLYSKCFKSLFISFIFIPLMLIECSKWNYFNESNFSEKGWENSFGDGSVGFEHGAHLRKILYLKFRRISHLKIAMVTAPICATKCTYIYVELAFYTYV